MKGKIFTLMMATALGLQAQPQEGKKNLEQLCGCFSVNFRYAETFAPSDSYKFHEREDMNAMELALPIESTDKKLVIQHLLIVADTMVIKHWREEWVYESPILYEYAGNKTWNKKELTAAEVKNKWTQTIWETNDEPRYQGVSSWVSNNNKTYWESTVDAPLPRREYTTRNDYNILKRGNRIQITPDGYVHEQDNEKLLREGGSDKLIAQEKGYNTYHRVEDKDCAVAKEWWKKNEAFWSVVRNKWNDYIAHNNTVAVKAKVDDKVLADHFTALWKDWNSQKVKTSELDAKVQEVLTKFL
jgi:hypothetical protein